MAKRCADCDERFENTFFANREETCPSCGSDEIRSVTVPIEDYD